MSVSRIVVGYDPSDRGERALESAVELSGALDAELHLVTAFADGPGGGVGITTERQHAEQLLDKATARISLPAAKVRHHAIPGKPADAIVEVATEVSADLIVIGNRGAQGVTRVLGSVATSIVGHAPCSVLVVKTA